MVAAATIGSLAWTVSGSLDDALLFFVMATATAACAHMLIGTYEEPAQWWSLAGSSVLWGAAGCGLIGLATIGNGLGLAVAAPLAILSPPVVDALSKGNRTSSKGADAPPDERRVRRELAPTDVPAQPRSERSSSTRSPTESPPVERSSPEPPWMTQSLASLDDAALCFAWRASYVALQQHPSAPVRLRVVQRRQAILDDLERRNAPGIAAWLASGARAAGDPTRYVTSAHRRTWNPIARQG